MRIIENPQQLRALADEHGLRDSWHEPDESGITARVEGGTFDNAGFWPTASVIGPFNRSLPSVEMHVVITHTSEDCDECGHGEAEDIAAVNLATLMAWACGFTGEG